VGTLSRTPQPLLHLECRLAQPDGFAGDLCAFHLIREHVNPLLQGARWVAQSMATSPISGCARLCAITVADLSHTEMSEGNVMAYAVLMLSRGGEVKIDIPHSTRRKREVDRPRCRGV
jgi:hypothetical protein